MTINKESGGLSYMIPYEAFKHSNSGTSQNISIQLDQGNGRSSVKVYHAPYNQQEQLDTMYDHANTGLIANTIDTVATGAVNQKLTQYYTQINGKREQDITIEVPFSILCLIGAKKRKYIEERKYLSIQLVSLFRLLTLALVMIKTIKVS